MAKVAAWHEVDSPVAWPNRWLAVAIGMAFFLFGIFGFAAIEEVTPPGMPLWIPRLSAVYIALLGAAALVIVAALGYLPRYVRHAAPDVLPDISSEPVTSQEATVQARLRYELAQVADAWHFRPSSFREWRDIGMFAGSAVGLAPAMASVAGWVAHEEFHVGDWPFAILCGVLAAVGIVGATVVIFIMLMRASYWRLCRLRIPLNGGNLELDWAARPGFKMVPLAGLNWGDPTACKGRHLTIPLELVRAVQLCPWKCVFPGIRGNTTALAVQGLLVLSEKGDATYCRLPILLTADFFGAARLMGELATTLDVPYLYVADADGWRAEKARAQDREPLRGGGLRI